MVRDTQPTPRVKGAPYVERDFTPRLPDSPPPDTGVRGRLIVALLFWLALAFVSAAYLIARWRGWL